MLHLMINVALAASLGQAAPKALEEPAQQVPLIVSQPDCDRAIEADAVTVCGRSNRRYRVDPSTLATMRAIEERDDPGRRPRPNAITQSCAGIGPMSDCGGSIPVSSMALAAASLVAKAIRGDDVRPAFHQGPPDYALYQREKKKLKVTLEVGSRRTRP